MRLRTLFIILGFFALVPAARAQADRFARFEPGLIVESGGRTGACDALTFSTDGRSLLATGDDKVVRVWRFTGQGLDPDAVQTLRWSIFREQRGNIYAMALSPDRESRLVAIGGLGARVASGSVAVLDRTTRQVVSAVVAPPSNTYAVWALAFSPSGQRVAYGKGDGSVGFWDWQPEMAREPVQLGTHSAADKSSGNKVRLVAFLDEDRLISVSESGQVLRWNMARPRDPPAVLHDFKDPRIFCAAISPKRNRLALGFQRASDRVVLLGLEGTVQSLPLAEDDLPHSLAFDAGGERLAVGIRIVADRARATFFKEKGGKVVLFDLRQQQPRPMPGPELSHKAEAVAFHPEGNYLATAGGNNHEVMLWDLKKPAAAPVSTIESAGSCLWSVALDQDGKHLGFRDQRQVDPASPNQWGKGPWRVFDLEKRVWAGRPGTFQPILPLETLQGWRVLPSPKDAFVWEVVSPGGKAFKLPIDPNRDAMPRCFTFLEGKPPRLAVGHYWGASIFELDAESGPRLVRLMVGHQGEVMAIAPSADRKLLVTASRDQTIAAWSLLPWKHQPELGASFQLRQGKVFVEAVEPGSPAWEAGLEAGDEIVLFSWHFQQLYDPENRSPADRRARFKKFLSAEECIKLLKQAEPAREHYFLVRRVGKKDPLECLTTVRQRPLWRFFPTRDREWVLWRWRDYYYDSSTNGDSHIGWQVSGDIAMTPLFFKAEQLRDRFRKPDMVTKMLKAIDAPEKVAIPDLEPPDVALVPDTRQVKDKDLIVTLKAVPRTAHPNQELDRVFLWINDYRFPETWPVGKGAFEKKVVIPRDKLRRGPNVLTLQAYNHAGARGEAEPVLIEYDGPPVQPRLFGVIVGVGDYSSTAPRLQRRRGPGDLKADKDARVMHKLWQAQSKKFFQGGEVDLLINEKATPVVVLARLASLADEVKPDDLLVFYLGGHGASAEIVTEIVDRGKEKPVDRLSPGSFAFLGPHFDPLRPNNTCLTSRHLYEALMKLPCQKLVLLDACHSGTAGEAPSVGVNPVRELTRDGIGPVILAACQPNQSAFECPRLDFLRSYGLFTMAIRQALNEEFARADQNHDQVLDAGEFVTYVKARVPQLFDQLRKENEPGLEPDDDQVPADFLPPRLTKRPLAKK